MCAVNLAPWHARHPGRLAGSVYAVEPVRRVASARALVDAGLDVHVDMMDESAGLPRGVTLAELREICDAVGGGAVGVHLIGSAAFVDRVLPRVLPLRPATVFLPWASFTSDRSRAIRASGGAAWIAVWDERDDIGAPDDEVPPWPAVPDGVLVMLIRPGTKDAAAPTRIAVAAAYAEHLPVAVDGGVTESVAGLCAAAGVSSMVVGRALLSSRSDDSAVPAGSPPVPSRSDPTPTLREKRYS